MINQYQSVPKEVSPIDYAFQILDAVSQGSFTKWSIAYDISTKKIYFQTGQSRDRKMVDMNAFDFSCGQSHFAYDMNQQESGDVSKSFTKASYALNKSMLVKAIEETGSRLSVSQKEIDESAELFRFSDCSGNAEKAANTLITNKSDWLKNILWILVIVLLALSVKPLILARNKHSF